MSILVETLRRVFFLALLLFGLAFPCYADDTSGGDHGANQPAIREAGVLDREARLATAIDDYAEALVNANRDARLAGFARAARAFASLTTDGVDTVALWTNLGNAALQAEDAGTAALAYHRALLLDPDAPAAIQNLAYLRSRLPSWVPRPDSTRAGHSFLDIERISRPGRALSASALFLVACCAIALAIRRQEGAWRGLALLAGLGWLALFASLYWTSLPGLAEGGSAAIDRAIIMGNGADARSADSPLAPLALPDPLPAGVEVAFQESRGDWSRVRLANGRDVWVRASRVARVARNLPESG